LSDVFLDMATIASYNRKLDGVRDRIEISVACDYSSMIALIVINPKAT